MAHHSHDITSTLLFCNQILVSLANRARTMTTSVSRLDGTLSTLVMDTVCSIAYIESHSDEKESEISNEIKKGISKALKSVVDQRPQLYGITQRNVIVVLNPLCCLDHDLPSPGHCQWRCGGDGGQGDDDRRRESLLLIGTNACSRAYAPRDAAHDEPHLATGSAHLSSLELHQSLSSHAKSSCTQASKTSFQPVSQTSLSVLPLVRPLLQMAVLRLTQSIPFLLGASLTLRFD